MVIGNGAITNGFRKFLSTRRTEFRDAIGMRWCMIGTLERGRSIKYQLRNWAYWQCQIDFHSDRRLSANGNTTRNLQGLSFHSALKQMRDVWNLIFRTRKLDFAPRANSASDAPCGYESRIQANGKRTTGKKRASQNNELQNPRANGALLFIDILLNRTKKRERERERKREREYFDGDGNQKTRFKSC